MRSSFDEDVNGMIDLTRARTARDSQCTQKGANERERERMAC